MFGIVMKHRITSLVRVECLQKKKNISLVQAPHKPRSSYPQNLKFKRLTETKEALDVPLNLNPFLNPYCVLFGRKIAVFLT